MSSFYIKYKRLFIFLNLLYLEFVVRQLVSFDSFMDIIIFDCIEITNYHINTYIKQIYVNK